jgi:nitrite reductase/ring-hydroxylating ferredoxin subunit
VLDGSRLVCPWHGWAYDVVTGEHESSAAQRIPTYEVRVESGQVLVKSE